MNEGTLPYEIFIFQYPLPDCGMSFLSLDNILHKAKRFYVNEVWLTILSFMKHAIAGVPKKSLIHYCSYMMDRDTMDSF
jgi:hypothetical protein